VDLGCLQRLFERQGRQDAGQSAGEHCFSGSGG
jgi:hypothetical protein